MSETVSTRAGQYQVRTFGGEAVRSFIPAPLPPDPPLQVERLYAATEAAGRALGKLDGLASILPDADLFLFAYVRKEALLSAQIEGTQSSLSDLLLFENDELPDAEIDDVRDVSNYIDAMNYGLDRLRAGIPLSSRLIREIHAKLLASGRGSAKQPGEFRSSQNWIGGTRPGNARYVPPPADQIADCMSDLEKFIHNETTGLPTLIRAALVHVQFETIHPFLDGNGRLGRLLITFMLCAEGVLRAPILYLSLYFKTHRQTYYDHLQSVRETGDWESWALYFLEGVIETAEEAAKSAREILDLFSKDRATVEGLGRSSANTLRILLLLQTKPIVTVPVAARQLGLTAPTVRSCIANLEENKIVREITGKKRGKAYIYDAYFKILERGTQPL